MLLSERAQLVPASHGGSRSKWNSESSPDGNHSNREYLGRSGINCLWHEVANASVVLNNWGIEALILQRD